MRLFKFLLITSIFFVATNSQAPKWLDKLRGKSSPKVGVGDFGITHVKPKRTSLSQVGAAEDQTRTGGRSILRPGKLNPKYAESTRRMFQDDTDRKEKATRNRKMGVLFNKQRDEGLTPEETKILGHLWGKQKTAPGAFVPKNTPLEREEGFATPE